MEERKLYKWTYDLGYGAAFGIVWASSIEDAKNLIMKNESLQSDIKWNDCESELSYISVEEVVESDDPVVYIGSFHE